MRHQSRSHPRARRRPNAFTLMEVVLALGLFAVLSIVLLDAVGQMQQAIHESKTDSQRAEFRRFVLRRALSTTSQISTTDGGDATLPDGTSASWTLSIAPTSLPDLHDATLEISWGDGDPEILTFRAYRPEWSDPATRSSLLQTHRTDYPPSRLSTY